MKGTVAAVLAVVVAITVAAASAGGRVERVQLKPNGVHVAASADLSSRGVELTVHGLPAGAPVTASIGLLECAGGRQTGYAYADEYGVARWGAKLPLSWDALHDGRHVVAVSSDLRTIACAPIPASHPTPHHWGIWSFALRFTD